MVMSRSTINIVEWSNSGLAAAYAGSILAGLGANVTRLGSLEGKTDSPLATARLTLDEGKFSREEKNWTEALEKADILLCDDVNALESSVGCIKELAKQYPLLIIGIHSIFGLEGPNAKLPATALDAQALSSVAWALGDPDREPLSIPAGVLEYQGGAMLSAACLAAFLVRQRGGQGQVVDIALADVLASYVGGNCRFYIHHGMRWHRSGKRATDSGGAYPFVILPTADGEVCLCGRTRAEWERLVKVMGSPDWTSKPRYKSLRKMGREYPDEVDELIKPWLAKHTMAELEKLAIDNSLIMAPLRSMLEVVETDSFHRSGFLDRQKVEKREYVVPKLPYFITEERRNDARSITASMLNKKGKASIKEESLGKERRPLENLKVLDFGWVWSAPWVASMLCELGAEVIKVEHGGRLDNLRLVGKIWRDGEVIEGPTTEMSPMYHQVNHGKLGVTLNLKEPKARALIDKLIKRCDLVIENMSPGSLERVGLGYEHFRVINPKLVMLAMSAGGQFGALKNMRAYAPTMSSFAGLDGLVGYPKEKPIGALNFALGDPNASVHALSPVLAGLLRAQVTDRGCYIDLSQTAALTATMRTWMIAAQEEGRQPDLIGNRHFDIAPHGIFPAKGEDSWLSIAVQSESAWRRLSEEVDWAGLPEFSCNKRRLENVDNLEKRLIAWTSHFNRDELVSKLRAMGIAASPVFSINEMWDAPQFKERDLKTRIDIPDYGKEDIFRAPWRFSRMKAEITNSAPQLGEHNQLVFEEILGLSNYEIKKLVDEGVIS